MNRAANDTTCESVNTAAGSPVAFAVAAKPSASVVESVAKRPPGAFAVAIRLLRIAVRGEFWSICAGLALMLTGALVGLLQPWPLKFIVDALTGATKPPPLLAQIASGLPQGAGPHAAKLAYISVLCLGLLLISVISAGINLLSTWVLVAAGLRMVFKLRCRMFDHIQRLPVSFHDASTVGDSLYRVTWDTYSVQSLFNQGLVPGITATVTLVGIAFVMVRQDWSIGLVTLLVAIILVVLIRRLEKPTTELSTMVHEHESGVSTRVQQTLVGIRAVQAFGREAFESDRFAQQASKSLSASLRLTVLQTAAQSGVAILFALGTAAVVWLAARRVIAGQMSAGDVVLLAGYAAMLFKPLETLSYTANSIQGSVAGARRVFEILDRHSSVSDAPNARTLNHRPRGEVALNKVSFEYRPGVPVLSEIDLRMPPGSAIALVGPSGAGKTTLASLLVRFYDPVAGCITLDGGDIRGITLESLRCNIAIVPQEPVLFDASIGENILYSRPHASGADLEAAARSAGAWEFIQSLPQRFDTPVGERGVLLSGGQKQRISLARAFLKDAQIIVLDEPTTGLDAQTEADLLVSLRRLMAGRTTIIISHHFSTVRFVDQIIVLERGRVVQRGTHEALIKKPGLYQSLYRLQHGDPAAEAP